MVSEPSSCNIPANTKRKSVTLQFMVIAVAISIFAGVVQNPITLSDQASPATKPQEPPPADTFPVPTHQVDCSEVRQLPGTSSVSCRVIYYKSHSSCKETSEVQGGEERPPYGVH